MLYLLKRIDPRGDQFADYDTNLGFVIRAGSEQEARNMASDAQVRAEYELINDRTYFTYKCQLGAPDWAGDEEPECWLDPKVSSCVPINPEGTSEFILRDFQAG